jgi:hypothetical protein
LESLWRGLYVSHFQICSPQAAIPHHRKRRITPRELKLWTETGEPLVVDFRLEVERQDGSIPGALAVAFEDLNSLLPAVAL